MSASSRPEGRALAVAPKVRKRGEVVSASKDSQTDLTSTIHISQLRPVPSTTALDALVERLSPEERKVVAQLSPEKAMLIGMTGPSKGFRYLLDSEEIRIGRELNSDIALDDVTVSRKHANISVRKGVFTITDSKSLNGTYVNAHSTASKVLEIGDEIQIGKFRFVFFTGKVFS